MSRDTCDCAPNRSGLGPSCQMPPRALFGASRQSVASKQRAPICFIPTRARAPPNPDYSTSFNGTYLQLVISMG